MNLIRFQQIENYQRRSSRLWDPRFDHNLIGQHQICRIGISAGPLGSVKVNIGLYSFRIKLF